MGALTGGLRRTALDPLRTFDLSIRALVAFVVPRKGDQMRRREFVGGAGMALVWPFEVRAQTAKIPRIGVLWFGSRGGPTPLFDGLKRALVERGYVLDGDHLIIDLRYAEGKPERYPAL